MPLHSACALTLSHLTLTGADDAVDPSALAHLSRAVPLIEWGILLSAEHEGRPRFPSARWRREFKAAAPAARSAAHLCGPALLRTLSGAPLPESYGRMQLNFSLLDLDPTDLDAWLGAWHAGGQGKPSTWITQHNPTNAGLHHRFGVRADPTDPAGPRHALLFDASGGTGIAPTAWPAALPGADCGYAGGLGPDTLAEQMPRIAAAVGHGKSTWIDMETALRVDDRFDLERVNAVVELLRNAAGGKPLVPGVRLRLPMEEGTS